VRRTAGVVLVAVVLAGCATRAELLQQDRELRSMVLEQRKQVQQVQRELERLRADVEEGGPRKGGGASTDDRITALEQRLGDLEHGSAATGTATAPPPEGLPPPSPPPHVAAVPPPAAPAPAREEDGWRREVATEQASAGAVNVPERGEYLGLLDSVAKQDCARVVPQLNSFATNHKDSPLADNALYWAARCYALKGDQNQAVSKFYDVVTKYPKGDKAPAALWAQGNLFVDMGDTPDARLALSKLIRDYPSSEEASRARQKLGELEH
jgi:tol-pal system protein YbgF